MSIFFEKARELAGLMLTSEQSLRLADAKAAFDSDTVAVTMLKDVNLRRKTLVEEMRDGNMTPEAYERESKSIGEKTEELYRRSAALELMNAQKEFNDFVHQIIHIVTAAVSGEMPEDREEGCGKDCCGCGKN